MCLFAFFMFHFALIMILVSDFNFASFLVEPTTTYSPSLSSLWQRVTAAANTYLLPLHPEGFTPSLPPLDFLPPSLPFATVPASRQCVTEPGAQSQTVCLQSDKKDGPEGEQSEAGREGHSGNIGKLDLAKRKWQVSDSTQA